MNDQDARRRLMRLETTLFVLIDTIEHIHMARPMTTDQLAHMEHTLAMFRQEVEAEARQYMEDQARRN